MEATAQQDLNFTNEVEIVSPQPVLGSVTLKSEHVTQPELSSNEKMFGSPSELKTLSHEEPLSESKTDVPDMQGANNVVPDKACEEPLSEIESDVPDVLSANNVQDDGVLELTQVKMKRCFVKLEPLSQDQLLASQERNITGSESVLNYNFEDCTAKVTITPCSVQIEPLSERQLLTFSTVKTCSIVVSKLSELHVKRYQSKLKCLVKGNDCVFSKSMTKIKTRGYVECKKSIVLPCIFKCDLCGKTFAMVNGYYKHLHTHSQG